MKVRKRQLEPGLLFIFSYINFQALRFLPPHPHSASCICKVVYCTIVSLFSLTLTLLHSAHFSAFFHVHRLPHPCIFIHRIPQRTAIKLQIIMGYAPRHRTPRVCPRTLLTVLYFLLLSSIAFLIADAALEPSDFPPSGHIPSVDSLEVRQWLSELDLSNAPSIDTNKGEPPECPSKVPEGVCYWTCEDCSADDVVECPDRNVWGITFDDGPTPATPELLRFLEEKGVKATFFLVGGNVVQYPELAVQEAQAGHHLASHT